MRRIAQALSGAVALLLTVTGVAHADVAHVNTTSVTATSTTVSLPAVAVSGTGRVLAVGISTTDAVTVSSVSYGSQALTSRVAGVRTLGVRFRVSSATPVRFSLERWKDKPGASACPPARGKAKADGRRIAGVYAAHSKRAVDARAGVNTVMLAATDGKGKRLRPGTYLLTIRSGEASARVKLWVLR